jgi:hypothetical protein
MYSYRFVLILNPRLILEVYTNAPAVQRVRAFAEREIKGLFSLVALYSQINHVMRGDADNNHKCAGQPLYFHEYQRYQIELPETGCEPGTSAKNNQ